MNARTRSGLLCLALAACAGDATQVGTNPGSGDLEPSPYIFEPGEAPEPGQALEDVESALQSAFDLTLEANAAPIRDAYAEVMAHSSGACPYYYATDDGAYWLDNCAAASGATYEGYVFSLDEEGTVLPNGFTVDTWYAFGGASIVDPDGDLLEIGGVAALQTIEGRVGEQGNIPVTTHVSQVRGSFVWEGASAAGTFLDLGIDPDLIVSLQEFEGIGRIAQVQGGFGGFDDGWAVAFDDNVMFTATLGSQCPQELSGTVAVRSPAGEWYDVRFDGPQEENQPVADEDCDGCGTAYFQGEPVGQVCADATSLLTWEGTPW